MLVIFPNFRGCLVQGLAVTPPSLPRVLNAEEVKQFDALALGWERGGEGQPTDADHPPISPQTGDGMLGKRTRADSSSEIHRAAKRGKFEDGKYVSPFVDYGHLTVTTYFLIDCCGTLNIKEVRVRRTREFPISGPNSNIPIGCARNR